MTFTPEELEAILRDLRPDSLMRSKVRRAHMHALSAPIHVECGKTPSSWLIDGRPYFDRSKAFRAALCAIESGSVRASDWCDSPAPANALWVCVKARRKPLREAGFAQLAKALDYLHCEGPLLVYHSHPTAPTISVNLV